MINKQAFYIYNYNLLLGTLWARNKYLNSQRRFIFTLQQLFHTAFNILWLIEIRATFLILSLMVRFLRCKSFPPSFFFHMICDNLLQCQGSTRLVLCALRTYVLSLCMVYLLSESDWSWFLLLRKEVRPPPMVLLRNREIQLCPFWKTPSLE